MQHKYSACLHCCEAYEHRARRCLLQCGRACRQEADFPTAQESLGIGEKKMSMEKSCCQQQQEQQLQNLCCIPHTMITSEHLLTS
eukprot:1148988-Pelagomonas_calceolata.AAC.7